MIQIDMTRQDTRHPDRLRRHPSRARCEVAGHRFEATGPGAIYKLSTLLWLHGHGGTDFEVWDDVSPTGRPGGLAMTGRVRNWARLVNGKPKFGGRGEPEPGFTSADRELIAQAAGKVADTPQRVAPTGDNARTGVSRPPDAPRYPPEQDRAPAAVVGARPLI